MYQSNYNSISLLSSLLPYLQDLLQIFDNSIQSQYNLIQNNTINQSLSVLNEMKNSLDYLKFIQIVFVECSSVPVRLIRETLQFPIQIPFCCKENILIWSKSFLSLLLELKPTMNLESIESIFSLYEDVIRQIFIVLVFPCLSQSNLLISQKEENIQKELLQLCVDIVSGDFNLMEYSGGIEYKDIKCYYLQRAIVQHLFINQVFVSKLEDKIIYSIENRKDYEECPICFESPMNNPVITSCSHVFCLICINEIHKLNQTCPICRREFSIVGEYKLNITSLSDCFQLMIQWYQDISFSTFETICTSNTENMNEDNTMIKIENILSNPVIDCIRKYGVRESCNILAIIQREIHIYSESLGNYLSNYVFSSVDKLKLKQSNQKFNEEKEITSLGIYPIRYLTQNSYWPNIFALRCLYHKFGDYIFSTILKQPITRSPLYWLSNEMRENLEEVFQESNVPKLNPYFLMEEYLKVFNLMSSIDKINKKYTKLCIDDVSPFNQSRSILFLYCVRKSIEIYGSNRLYNDIPNQLTELNSSLGKSQGIFNSLNNTDCYWNRLINSPETNIIRGYEEKLYSFLLSPKIQSIEWFGKLNNETSPVNILKLQVLFHIVSMSMKYSQGWVYLLLLQPSQLQSIYLPSMPDDEIQMILQSLDRTRTGAKQAYKCECGYYYFIGDCGKPYMVAKCPNCNRDLGGTKHNLVGTSKVVDDSELLGNSKVKGYIYDACQSENCQIGRNITPFMCCYIRLIIHSCLTLSITLILSLIEQKSVSREFISNLLQSINIFLGLPIGLNNNTTNNLNNNNNNNNNTQNNELKLIISLQKWCQDRFFQDWIILRNCTSSSDEDLSILLHYMISKSDQIFSTSINEFSSVENRFQWERIHFEGIIQPILQRENGIDVNQIRLIITSNQKEDFMNQKKFYEIISEKYNKEKYENNQNNDINLEEKYENNDDNQNNENKIIDSNSIDSFIWSYKKRITINDFKHQFALDIRNFELYPFIQTIIQYENSLSSANILIPIFEWHQYLFSLFPSGTLSRQDALRITNIEAVNMSCKGNKEKLMNILNSFIKAFNSSFCDVEYIFECRENHLRYTFKMSYETPIVFSLPSPAPPGGEASEGICTIALIEMLRNRQNNLLDLLLEQQIRYVNNNENNDELLKIITITQTTSPSILSRVLCSYNPNEHLLPLLFGYSIHNLKGDNLKSTSYDYNRINLALGNMLCNGKQKLALQLMLYEFSGEIYRSGILTTLNRLIPQRELPLGIEEAIKGELLRHSNLPDLLKLLEISLRFLTSSSMGMGNLDLKDDDNIINVENNNNFENKNNGDEEEKLPDLTPQITTTTTITINSFFQLSLEEFFLNVLRLSLNYWEEVSIPILRNRYISLVHILHIYQLIQFSLGIDPLEKLDVKYKKSLSSKEKRILESIFSIEFLRIQSNQIFIKNLIKLLVWVMTENLVENISINEKISLKREFLIYIEEFETLEGFERYFPEELNLEHIWEVYQYLCSLEEKKIV